MVEVSHFSPQCWHEEIAQTRLNQGPSLTSLPRNGSLILNPLESPHRPRNGFLSSTAPRHLTVHPSNSVETGLHPTIACGNEYDWNTQRHQRRRKFVHFQDGKKKVLQYMCPPMEEYAVATPVAMHELQLSPVNTAKSRAKYNFNPPRKPPRALSQTSLTKSLATGDSFTSLCSSASQPYSSTTRGTVEWNCPQAPLAEDEVKDAYVLLHPSEG